MRRALLALALCACLPTVAAAQPCTSDAQRVVNELYRHLLERQPDPGSEHWVRQLESGTITVRQLVGEITTSSEHMRRFVYTESGESIPYERSVGRLYRHLLGRQPDAEGQRHYARMAQENGAQAVIESILNSPEYRERYGEWGVPGSGGVSFCAPAGAVSGGPFESIESGDEFDRLDRNDDLRLSAWEWNGSQWAFNTRDLNGDGWLSPNEYYGFATGEGAQAYTDTFLVDPRETWTDTGINLRAGDVVEFNTRGSVQLSRDPNDIADPAGTRSWRRADRAPLPTERAGAIIARIGWGDPFIVGDYNTVRASTSGRLYLGVNDDYMADNSGRFYVAVNVR